jgi:hypothetical protein
MSHAERAFIICLTLAVGLLMALYALSNVWRPIPGMFVLGVVGVVAHWRWRWLASLAFAGLVVLAANGALWYHLSPAGLLVVICATLAAWDLDEFSARLKRYHDSAYAAALWREHLRRLLVVLGAGLALGWAALNLDLALSFGVTVLLTVLAFFGLAQAARMLRRS